MNPLLLWGLGVVGVLVLSAVVYGLGIRTGYAFGRSSSPETREEPAAVARTVHPNCRSTMVRVDGSGQTISGTWNEHSATTTSTTSGREGPSGFRGEDLSDREVDEWLREWGLRGYD